MSQGKRRYDGHNRKPGKRKKRSRHRRLRRSVSVKWRRSLLPDLMPA